MNVHSFKYLMYRFFKLCFLWGEPKIPSTCSASSRRPITNALRPRKRLGWFRWNRDRWSGSIPRTCAWRPLRPNIVCIFTITPAFEFGRLSPTSLCVFRSINRFYRQLWTLRLPQQKSLTVVKYNVNVRYGTTNIQTIVVENAKKRIEKNRTGIDFIVIDLE